MQPKHTRQKLSRSCLAANRSPFQQYTCFKSHKTLYSTCLPSFMLVAWCKDKESDNTKFYNLLGCSYGDIQLQSQKLDPSDYHKGRVIYNNDSRNKHSPLLLFFWKDASATNLTGCTSLEKCERWQVYVKYSLVCTGTWKYLRLLRVASSIH